MNKWLASGRGLVPIAFAQNSNISVALTELKNTTQNFLGVTVTICSIPLLIIAIALGGLYFSKPRAQRNKWMLALAVLAFLAAIGLILFYLLTPWVVSTLVGVPIE